MKKWLRWQGLIVFFCIAIFLSILWFVLVDFFAERMIEKLGTDIVGAKVELDNADITLFPLGLELKRLQVTNPDEPMTNIFEAGRINFSVDGFNLLRRKIIIDKMSVKGAEIGTTRKSSGAISRKKKMPATMQDKAEGEKPALPSFKTPDVNMILQNERLQSLELINSLTTEMDAEKRKWQQTVKNLPGKERIAEYQKQIDALKKADKKGLSSIIEGVGKGAALKKDIEHDIKQIYGTQKEFQEELASLKKRMDEAIKAPGEDIRRLKNKYTLSPKGLGNISRYLAGPETGKKVDQAISWYYRLKPVLERTIRDKEEGHKVVKPVRGKGVNVVYKEHTPLPDFLIRLIDVSLNLKAGDLAGKIKNVTPDQDVLGLPTTFIFSGDNLKDAKSIGIKGNLNHIDPLNPTDTIKARLKGYRLRDINLSDQEALPVTIKDGFADLKLNTVLKGEDIFADITASFKSCRLITKTTGSEGFVAKEIASALSEISDFNLKADITGPLDDYKMHIKSNLDKVLKNAVGKTVKKHSANLEKKLSSAINEKVKGPTGNLQDSYTHLMPVGDELSGRLTRFKGLLGGIGTTKVPGGIKLPF